MDETRMMITPPVQRLIEMNTETVTAKDLAPILHMSESVIVKYAKDGTWDQDHLGKFVISGERVKFFRKDFLVKCGFMDPEPEETTERQALAALIEAFETLLNAQKQVIMLLEEQNRLLKEGAIERCIRENGLRF